MNPTQNNKDGKGNEKRFRWQEPEPERTQKFITPEAEKSLREGAGRYRSLKSGAPPVRKRREGRPAAGNTDGAGGSQSAPGYDGKSGTNPPISQRERGKSGAKREKLTLAEAVRGELRDRLHMLRMGISLNSDDVLRGVICAALIIVTALLQTTFFNKFAPFGAVPDMMLSLTAAIALWEGERWGSVCGLCAAFVIQSLGATGNAPQLLALLYVPVGCAVGILSSRYLRNGLPVKAVYIACCCAGRAVISAVTASVTLGASAGQIFLHIVLPEFFSTALIAPAVYLTVWLCLHRFHKSREQRTGDGDTL